MSLNIKNKRTTALVRELARRTGKSQTRAVEEAVEAQLAALESEAHRERQTADANARELLKRLQESLTENERAALRVVELDLFDESGLPG
jgi:antitoxin VapB